MFISLQKMLAPPVFADEDQTRLAGLLNGMTWIFLGIMTAYVVILPILQPQLAPRLIFTLPLFGLMLLIRFIIQRGQVYVASAFLVIGIWIELIALAVINGGVIAVSYSGCTVVVLFAGMLLGRRAALLTAAASIVAGLALVYGDQVGVVRPTPTASIPVTIWAVQSIFFIIAALVLHLATQSIGEALARAKLELTERKRAQELLSQNQQLLQAIIDNSPAMIYVKDIHGRYQLVNRRFLELTRLNVSQVIDRTDYDLYPPSVAETFRANDQTVIDSGDPHMAEETANFSDGDHTAISSKFPLRDASGAIYAICGISTDITGRKRAEAAQRESEERFARLAEATFEGIGIGEDGIIVDANDQLVRMFGYDLKELIGIKVDDLIAPESREWVNAQTESQNTEPYEHLAIRKDRSIFPVEVHAKRIQDHDRLVTVAAIRDITERKAQQAIEERRRVLLEKVVQLGKAVAQTTEWQACLLKIYESVRFGLDFDRVALFIYNATSHELESALGTDRSGVMIETWHSDSMYDFDQPFQDVLTSPTGFRITRDYTGEFVDSPEHSMFGVKDHVLAAVWAGEQPIGILAVDNLLSQRSITDEQLEALRLLAGYVGLALANAQSVAQLQTAEQKYRSIFENAVEGIFQVTRDGHLLSANPALARMYGYAAPTELVAAITDISQQVFLDPEHFTQLRQLLEEFGEVRGYESQIVRRDGQVIWISENTRAVLDAQRQTLYFEGAVEDITEYKNAEAALRASEEKFTRVFQVSPIGMSITRLADNVYLDINDSFIAGIGYNREEVIGHTGAELNIWVDNQELLRLHEHLKAKGSAHEVEFQYRHRSGQIRIASLSAEIIELNGILCVLSTITDITRRKHAEAALLEAELRYRTLVEQLPVVIYRDSPKTVAEALYVSPQIEALIDYSPEEWTADPYFWQKLVHPEDLERVLFDIEQHLEHGEKSVVEYRLLARDGHIVWVRDESQVILNADGQPQFVQGAFSDITERKQAETALKRYTARLESLADIDRAILTAQSPQAIALAAAESTRQLIDIQRVSVSLFDFQTRRSLLLAVSAVGPTYLPTGSSISFEDFGIVMIDRLQKGELYVIEDVLTAEIVTEIDRQHLPFGIRGWLHQPLLYQGELIGSLNLGSSQPSSFTPEQMDIAHQVADQLAIAIRHSQLLQETQQRANQLSILNEIGRAVSTLRELPEVLDLIYQQIQRSLPLDLFFVGLYDSATDEISFPLIYEGEQRWQEPSGPLAPSSNAAQIIRTGQPLLINRSTFEVSETSSAAIAIGDKARRSASLLFAPLQTGSRTIGVISVQSYSFNAHTQQHLDLLTGVSHHLSVAIENARLFKAEQEQVALLTALYQTGLDLTTELDLSSLLQTIVERAARLVGASMGSMYLVQADGNTLNRVVQYNFQDQFAIAQIRVGEGVAGRVAQSGEPLVVAEYETWPGRIRRVPGFAFRSVLGVPVKWQGRVVGVINILDEHQARFSHTDIETVSLFAAQAAVAIQNARMFEAEQSRVDLLTALYQTGLDLTTQLDLPSLLQTIVERAARLAGASMGSLYMVEPGGETLKLVVRHNLQDQFAVPQIRTGEGVAGQVALNGEPLVVNDYETWPGRIMYVPGLTFRSVLGVPVKWQGQVLGVINVLHENPTRFGRDQVETVSLFAAQAAVAIQNARLFQAEQQRVEVFAALHQIGLDLNAQLDLPTLLRTIMERAARLLNAPMGGLYLLQPDGVTLQPVANLPADDVSSPVRLGEGLVGQVAVSGVPLVIPDYMLWPGRLASITNPPFRAVVGVPIQWQQESLGVVSVCDLQPGRFGPDDAEIVRLFALQAAVAIQNAKLFNATQRQVEELSILRSAAVAASETLTEDELIERVTRMLGQALFHESCGFLLIDFDKSVLRVHPSHLGMSDEMKQALIPLGEGVTGIVAARGEPWRLGDVRLEPTYRVANAEMLSELCVPLKTGDRVIGVVNVESTQLDAFNELDERLLFTIAGQIAPAIERLRAEAQVRRLNAELERRVAERTSQLKIANRELEAFSYSVSHDLRAPLRSIDGFSQALIEDYYDHLEPEGRRYLEIVREECQRMGQLIDDLINLARVTRAEFNGVAVDLSLLADSLIAALRQRQPDRQVKVIVTPQLLTYGDFNLLRIMLDNVLGNAWKFTGKQSEAQIEVGLAEQSGQAKVFFVRDNGAGFDMTYANKLFGAFQRLHTQTEFDGTGIGLATVQRILHRHGGRVWATSKINEGTTFYFELPNEGHQP